MIVSEEGTHANILFFDKETGIMERFDPYGNVPYLDGDKLDDVIKDKIGTYLDAYFKKQSKKFQYLRPRDYMHNVSFQVISDDGNIVMRKLGDPTGYCLAWIFWYIEMRISNPDIHPKQLIQKAIEKIQKRKGDSKKVFIDFIRNYAIKLDHKKNQILKRSGIKDKDLYNIVHNKKNYTKIIDTVASLFRKMVDERITL